MRTYVWKSSEEEKASRVLVVVVVFVVMVVAVFLVVFGGSGNSRICRAVLVNTHCLLYLHSAHRRVKPNLCVRQWQTPNSQPPIMLLRPCLQRR